MAGRGESQVDVRPPIERFGFRFEPLLGLRPRAASRAAPAGRQLFAAPRAPEWRQLLARHATGLAV
jgi:hypothetical protein